MNESTDRRGLKGFLDKGGFWRLVALLVVYFAIYLGAGQVAGKSVGMPKASCSTACRTSSSP